MIKLRLEFEASEEDLKNCISASWKKRFEEPLGPEDISDFEENYIMPELDLESLVAGSCLAALIDPSEAVLKRVPLL